MKLSIIIPYYNNGNYFKRCFDSLLQQELKSDEFEIIVVDDGSTEDTGRLLSYIEKHDNIRYIRQENAGPGAARNRGLDVAQGEYVFFCDSDDFIAENVLGSLYQIACNNKLDMLFHNRIHLKEGESAKQNKRNFEKIEIFPSGKHYFGSIEGYIKSGPTFYIINRLFIERNKLRFPNFIVTEDTAFYIDALLSAGHVAVVDVDVYYYVIYPNSLLHGVGPKKFTGRYLDNIYQFIQKVSIVIGSVDPDILPKGCLENLKRLRNDKTIKMLSCIYKNCPFPTILRYTSKLKKLGAFPVDMYGNKSLVIRIMNSSFLWYLFIVLIGILPLNLRMKIFYRS